MRRAPRKPKKVRPVKSRRNRRLIDETISAMEEEDLDEIPECTLGADKK